MDFNELTKLYKQHNQIDFGVNNIESFYGNGLNDLIKLNEQQQLQNSKFFVSYRIPLNTTVFADALVSRVNNGDNTFLPELALMFLKTYSKEIFEKTNYVINPKTLITVFNKNQELVEIPYSVALLLGGLYYFQENKMLIGDLSPNSLYSRINGVKQFANNNDIYDNVELYRTPGTYLRSTKKEEVIGVNGSARVRLLTPETVKFPSVRLLNRSLYFSDNVNFNIKTNVNNDNEVLENVKIKTKSILPSVGFGIQNNFLNHYNKILFGDYLNGSKTKQNDGLPHVLAGGYSGILKPIKTYDSDQIEFTAFYRNLSVDNFKFNDTELVTELSNATKSLKKLPKNVTPTNSYEEKIKNAFIKSFIVYSKLKATYLSSDFPSNAKNELNRLITLLCEVNNIDSQYNTESGTIKLCDFYYLVSHVFFTTYHRIEVGVREFDQLDTQIFDIKNRLNFGIRYSNTYQASAIGDDLNVILNTKYSTKSEQINSLTNFLHKIWSLEKINLKENYRSISKATFALYPSAGGSISPNTLITSGNEDYNENSLFFNVSNEYKEYVETRPQFFNFKRPDGNPTYDKSFGDIGLNLVKSGVMVDPFNSNSPKTLFNNLVEKTKRNYITDINNPTKAKYILEKNFDRIKFLNNYCFNNHSILNNTTRFFWFESNQLGNDLKLDTSYLNNENYDENNNGIKSLFNTGELENNLNYLRNTNLGLYDSNTFLINSNNSYLSNFDFNRLMDSINIEKLIEFSEEFKKFATISSNDSSNKFNLNSLLKASTIITESDLLSSNTVIDTIITEGVIIGDGGLSLTKEDITVMLIGNSMYNYEFLSKCGASKLLNIALTSAQKIRCENVVNEFTTNIITFANKSTIDSVTKLGDFQLSIHNFHSSPEVLFTNSKSYNELKEKLKDETVSNLSFNKLIARRILLGNQYVEPYVNIENIQTFINIQNIKIIDELKELNRSYLYSKLHHPISPVGKEIRYDNYYVSIVKSFFKYLNIRYTKENYKQLLKLIRGYVYFVSKENNIINNDFLPNNGIISSDVYQNYVNRIKTTRNFTLNPLDNIDFGFTEYPILQDDKLEILADIYFTNFNTSTFESIVSGLNGFLDSINTNFNSRLNSDSKESLATKSSRDEMVNEFKKTTYYNVKSLFDKVSTGGLEQSTNRGTPNLFIPSKIEEIKSIEVGDYLSFSKLFYNYTINPNYCYGDGVITDQTYDLYQIFQVVDRGNNDIGDKTLADLVYLYNNLYTDFSTEMLSNDSGNAVIKNLTQKSLQSLFSGLAQGNGFLFQQIPNYVNLNGYLGKLNDTTQKNAGEAIYELVDELFGVHTDISLLGENSGTAFGGLTGFPGYIFQLGSLTSNPSTNNQLEMLKKNDNLNSFCLDVGYDNNREISVKAEGAPDEILKSNVTCFTVDFGTQNQQMFNSLQLDTTEFYDTEESIRAWVDVVNKTQQTIQSSNIFPILEKRSYSCTVTGLGNATIQPLSYFYLRNVPLFYGTYWITNVSHDIKPNTMTTTFKGVRQPIASKKDTRKALLNLMRLKAEELKEVNQTANVIQTEGIPDTNGEIYSIPTGSQTNSENDPYGYVTQKTTVDNYFKFEGINILSSFIFSITKSDNDDVANVGLINVLYNQSRALVETDTHSDVIRNMKDIAIGIMNQKAKNGDGRYTQSGLSNSDNVSLSKLIKENKFSTSSKLYTLLNDMSSSYDSYTKKDELIKLQDSDKIYSIKITTPLSNNTSGDLIKFAMDGEITTKSASTIPIIESSFFIEENDLTIKGKTTIDGFGSTSDDPSLFPDMITLFESKLSENGEIKKLNESVDIVKTKPSDKVILEDKPVLKSDELLNKWFDFLENSSAAASQFGLFASDGTYNKIRYEAYISNAGGDPTGDNKWELLPKKPNGNALEAIYFGIFNPIPKVTDPSGVINFSFNLGGTSSIYGFKQYDIDTAREKNRFIEDYKKIITDRQNKWEKDNKKEADQLSTTTVKFLGSYLPGKVAFFTANAGGNTPFGKITWSNQIKKKYKLTDANDTQLSNEFIPKKNSPEREPFIRSLIINADNEFDNWRVGGTILKDELYGKNSTVTNLLDKYWKVANGAEKYDGSSAWSAAFISYIIKDAAPSPNDFKYSTKHAIYIVNARDAKKSWKAYSAKDNSVILKEGDLLCYARNGGQKITLELKDFTSDQDGHCDCVTEIKNGEFAKVIGGNLSDSVSFANVNLNANGSVNDPHRTVILRFEPPATETPAGNYKTAYPELAFTEPPPPSNLLPYETAVNYLKNKYGNDIGKSVFAILFAEASKSDGAFRSAGGHNYAGVQTDNARWKAPGIIGQYSRIDSGNVRRSFAIFANDESFLDFMANRVKSKGFTGTNGDQWTSTYINSWWSPKAKGEYTKGTDKYNSKLAIYNSASNRFDKLIS
jgi:hypothetical protein